MELHNNISKRKIDATLLHHVYNQSYVGQMTSLFCASVIFISLYRTLSNDLLFMGWYIYFDVIIAIRLVCAKLYLMSPNPDKNLRFWKNLFILGALLGGVGWGMAGSVIFSMTDNAHQMLIILILAGITAGASPLLAAELTSSIVFVSGALVPLIFQITYNDNNIAYSLFSVTLIAYYLYLIVVTIKLNQTIKGSVALKFENDVLLETLSNAKQQLELNNQKLTLVASHDPLTKAANRHSFEDTVNKAIARAQELKRIMALLYIDIDSFKTVNDIYGHAAGDKLLIKVVERLRQIIRENDMIARLGGDEIVVFIENITDPEIIFNITKVISKELAQPFLINTHTLLVTASIGVSIFPLDGNDVESLLKSADKSMYHVKQNGKNSFHFSDDFFTKKNELGLLFKSLNKD